MQRPGSTDRAAPGCRCPAARPGRVTPRPGPRGTGPRARTWGAKVFRDEGPNPRRDRGPQPLVGHSATVGSAVESLIAIASFDRARLGAFERPSIDSVRRVAP